MTSKEQQRQIAAREARLTAAGHTETCAARRYLLCDCGATPPPKPIDPERAANLRRLSQALTGALLASTVLVGGLQLLSAALFLSIFAGRLQRLEREALLEEDDEN